jgi:hypothetical protein
MQTMINPICVSRQSPSFAQSAKRRRMSDKKPQRTRTVDLEAAREVRDLIKASGQTQAQVADYLTRRLSDTYEHYHVSRIIGGNRKIRSDEMDALRELAAAAPGIVPPAAPQLEPTTDSIPLFGYANAAGATLRLNEEQRVGVVPIHPAQKGSRGAFAFIVFGDSMSERLNHGDVAYAIRNMAPLKDKPCLIEMKNGEAIVKVFVGMDEHTLFARQLSPKKDLTFPLRDIAALHRVVGSTF